MIDIDYDEERYKLLSNKINDICDDLSKNTTLIFDRFYLHLAFLIGFCSVLHYNFDGETLFGIIECLIVGDSDLGKSKIADALVNYIGLGVSQSCDTAKRTGLLGGLEQVNKKWFIKWGIIPKNDRKLVILEDLKGANEETITELKNLRSRKIAEMSGMVNRKTPARTRIIATSNPRSNIKDVASYSFGIQIIKELMGNLEDVRRVDFALVIAKNEINLNEIRDRQKTHKLTKPKYSSESFRKLILWIWSRKANQIKFEGGFRESALETTKQICKEFSDSIPLVSQGSMLNKLIKISIALAALTFNVEDKETLLVEKIHLKYAYDFLIKIYSKEACGYKAFTIDDNFSKILRESDKKEIKRILTKTKESINQKDLIEQLLHADELDRDCFMDWCDLIRDDAQTFLGALVRKRALFKNGFKYVKSPGFIKLLKEMLKELKTSNKEEKLSNNILEGEEF